MKIALINPFINYKSNNKKIHLGLHILENSLTSKGHKVILIDAQLFEINDLIILDELKAFNAEMVGFSLLPASYQYAKPLIEAIVKVIKPTPIIVIGNHLANLFKEKLFEIIPELDFLILSEAEDTLVQLANALEYGRSIVNIPNIIARIDDKIIKTKICKTKSTLEKSNIVEPAYLYEILPLTIPEKSISYLSSLGCKGKCYFCVSEVTGIRKKFLDYKSAERIVNDIAYYKKKYQVEGIDFVDDDFLSPPKVRAYEFANLLIKNDLDINFWFSTRADRINNNILIPLKSAGLSAVFIGIESFLLNRLNRFNKQISLEKIFNAITICKELNIDLRIGFIFFDPFSTIDEIVKDLCCIIDLEMQYSIAILFQQLKIYPNTEAEHLLIKNNLKLGIDKNEMKIKYRYLDSRVQKLIKYVELWNVNLLPTILNFLELSCHKRTKKNWQLGMDADQIFRKLRSYEIVFFETILKDICYIDDNDVYNLLDLYYEKFQTEISKWNEKCSRNYSTLIEYSLTKQFSI